MSDPAPFLLDSASGRGAEVPILCERNPRAGLPILQKKKFMVPRSLKMGELRQHVLFVVSFQGTPGRGKEEYVSTGNLTIVSSIFRIPKSGEEQVSKEQRGLVLCRFLQVNLLCAESVFRWFRSTCSIFS